jgi:hypothetical protein
MPANSKLGPKKQVKLRIVLLKPPAGVDFGLQQGRGSSYQSIEVQRSQGSDVQFDFPIEANTGSNSPNFSGPFVQGPPNERFLYIDIGTCAGQQEGWSRRLKIPLTGITNEMIHTGAILEARIPGTARDGGPSCAYAWRKDAGPSWGWNVLR